MTKYPRRFELKIHQKIYNLEPDIVKNIKIMRLRRVSNCRVYGTTKLHKIRNIFDRRGPTERHDDTRMMWRMISEHWGCEVGEYRYRTERDDDTSLEEANAHNGL